LEHDILETGNGNNPFTEGFESKEVCWTVRMYCHMMQNDDTKYACFQPACELEVLPGYA